MGKGEPRSFRLRLRRPKEQTTSVVSRGLSPLLGGEEAGWEVWLRDQRLREKVGKLMFARTINIGSSAAAHRFRGGVR